MVVIVRDELDRRSQARAWARVARAAAHAYDVAGSAVTANRELFDAIEFAATDARLELLDLVDAYAAGARGLALRSVRRRRGLPAPHRRRPTARPVRHVRARRARAARLAPPAGAATRHRAGRAPRARRPEDRIEQARLAVADILDGAGAADDQEIDTFIRQLRIEQCDLLSVLTAAAWLAAQRARLARQRDITLPGPAWATPQEIADDRGAPLDLVEQLVDDALRQGLLTAPTPRHVVLTPAGPSTPSTRRPRGRPHRKSSTVNAARSTSCERIVHTLRGDGGSVSWRHGRIRRRAALR